MRGKRKADAHSSRMTARSVLAKQGIVMPEAPEPSSDVVRVNLNESGGAIRIEPIELDLPQTIGYSKLEVPVGLQQSSDSDIVAIRNAIDTQVLNDCSDRYRACHYGKYRIKNNDRWRAFDVCELITCVSCLCDLLQDPVSKEIKADPHPQCKGCKQWRSPVSMLDQTLIRSNPRRPAS